MIQAGLIAAGLAGHTLVAMVENASLPDESVILPRLDLLSLTADAALGSGPALILIGDAISGGDRARTAGRSRVEVSLAQV